MKELTCPLCGIMLTGVNGVFKFACGTTYPLQGGFAPGFKQSYECSEGLRLRNKIPFNQRAAEKHAQEPLPY